MVTLRRNQWSLWAGIRRKDDRRIHRIRIIATRVSYMDRQIKRHRNVFSRCRIRYNPRRRDSACQYWYGRRNEDPGATAYIRVIVERSDDAYINIPVRGSAVGLYVPRCNRRPTVFYHVFRRSGPHIRYRSNKSEIRLVIYNPESRILRILNAGIGDLYVNGKRVRRIVLDGGIPCHR